MKSHLEIQVNTRPAGKAQVVDVDGEIDLYTSQVLQKCLLNLMEQGQKYLVVDLEDVGYLDSTGLGILMNTSGQLQDQGGSLAIVCTNERVLRIFELIGMLDSFRVFPSEAEALASFD
jgi:anti-sigma B factor antagonist